LVVVRTADDRVIATIPQPGYPDLVTMEPTGRYAFVTNRRADVVTVIDITTHTQVRAIAVGRAPTEWPCGPNRRARHGGDGVRTTSGGRQWRGDRESKAGREDPVGPGLGCARRSAGERMDGARACPAYEVVPVAESGRLTGSVRFAGPLPRLEPVPVRKNHDVCGQSVPNEALIVGLERGVKGSVILIEGVARGKKPAGDVILNNAKCLFVPHVSALMAGAGS
jgi:YVTN family beta-propeller protein